MNKSDFLEELANILMKNASEITLDAELSSFDTWDSMGKLSLLAMLDSNLSKPLEPGVLDRARTVQDLISMLEL